MSWGNYFFGGRGSPWGSAPPAHTPEITPSDYSYINPEEESPSRGYGEHYFPNRPSSGYGRPQGRGQAEVEPDVLIIKHKATHFELPFPAYCISEGTLRVGDIRKAAAERLNVREARRVRLLYKHRELKDNAAAAGEEGLKQNSEITCIVSEAGDRFSSSEEDSPSESEIRASYIENPGDNSKRPNDKSGRKGKSGKKRSDRRARTPQQDADGNGGGYFPSDSSRDRRPGNNGRADPRPTGTSARGPTATTGSSSRTGGSAAATPTPSASAFDSSLPSAAPSPPALKELSDLETKFRNELAGPAEQLLANPPQDVKKRDYEVIRLTEMIERDVILKTDAIDAEGRADIRQKRRKLVNDAQAMLNRLDEAKKAWKKS